MVAVVVSNMTAAVKKKIIAALDEKMTAAE
jgi:hypothetical protein